MDDKNNGEIKMKMKSKRKKKKPVFTTVIIVVLLVMLTVIAVVFGFVWDKISKIQKVPDDDSDPYYVPPGSDYMETDEPGYDETDYVTDAFDTREPAGTAAPGADTQLPAVDTQKPVETEPVIETVDPLKKGDLINIMIVGEDKREAGQARQRSDTMILISVNPKTKKVSMISFLRDMYVSIPGGYKNNKLNAAYRFGGFKLMKETYKQNFGITIDGCFAGDFFDFVEIIDMLGGVEITVTQKESDYSNGLLPVGTSTLNGEQALAYSRIRKIDSDYARANRQRTVLMSLFNKFKNSSLADLNSIADAILPKLSTDMSNGDILSLMTKILPLVGSMEVNTYSIPYLGGYSHAMINGASVEIVDFKDMRNKLENEYLPY